MRSPVEADSVGRKVIAGADLAAFARARPTPPRIPRGSAGRRGTASSAWSTDIQSDKVMSQVEIQCGPHRVVSLMSTEAVDELALEVGSLAVAVVKATHIIVETPGGTA